jgi:hypothetical protein
MRKGEVLGGAVGLAPEPRDGIKLTINSSVNRCFSLPLSGIHNGSFSVDYSWAIDWGDGSSENVAGTTVMGAYIKHDYPRPDTTYIITIKPQEWPSVIPSDGPGWFSAFGFGIENSNKSGIFSDKPDLLPDMSEDKSKLLYVDGILDDYAVNASGGGTCWATFSGCENLRMGPNFNFGITKTESRGFGYAMFYRCASLVVNDVFTFPQFTSNSVNRSCFEALFAGITARQKRAMVEIIGNVMNGYGNDAPRRPIGTFSDAFDTTGIKNPNWYTDSGRAI